MVTERAEVRPRVIEVYRAIILNEEGKILLGQRSVNDRSGSLQWEVFGGKREPGQTPVAALVREVVEETGLIIVPGELVYEEETTLTEGPHAGKTYKLQVCTATVAGGTLVSSEEHDDARWFELDEALTLDLTTQTRNAFLALREKLSNRQNSG